NARIRPAWHQRRRAAPPLDGQIHLSQPRVSFTDPAMDDAIVAIAHEGSLVPRNGLTVGQVCKSRPQRRCPGLGTVVGLASSENLHNRRRLVSLSELIKRQRP